MEKKMAKPEMGEAMVKVRAASSQKERASHERLDAETMVRVQMRELENATRVWAREVLAGEVVPGVSQDAPTPELIAFLQNFCAAIKREERSLAEAREASAAYEAAQAELLKAAGLR